MSINFKPKVHVFSWKLADFQIFEKDKEKLLRIRTVSRKRNEAWLET